MKFHDSCFNKVFHFVVLSDLIYTGENREVVVAWIPNLNIRKTMIKQIHHITSYSDQEQDVQHIQYIEPELLVGRSVVLYFWPKGKFYIQSKTFISRAISPLHTQKLLWI